MPSRDPGHGGWLLTVVDVPNGPPGAGPPHDYSSELWVVEAERARQPYGLRLPGVKISPALGQMHFHSCLRALSLFEVGSARCADRTPQRGVPTMCQKWILFYRDKNSTMARAASLVI